MLLGLRAVVLLSLSTAPARAVEWTQEAKLQNFDWRGHYGEAVTVDGRTGVVGAWAVGTDTSKVGAAYVVGNDGAGWTHTATLVADDASNLDEFGRAVAIDGDTVVVGAPHDRSAYVFGKSASGWSQVAHLIPSAGAIEFGLSVDVFRDTVLVGARGAVVGDANPGAAYVFENSDAGWTEVVELVASDGGRDDYFGESVSLSGNFALVGAPRHSAVGYQSGAAYVFEETAGVWSEVTKLVPDDANSQAAFGDSVCLDGDLAVVSAPQHNDPGGPVQGAAYVFEHSDTGWTQAAKLVPDDIEPFDYFGSAVAISGHRIIVGAELEDANARSSGSAYIFERTEAGWVQTAKLLADDGAESDLFGCAVAIDGDVAFVGAWLKDGYGAAYVYTIPEPSTLIALLTLSATAAPLMLLRRARRAR